MSVGDDGHVQTQEERDQKTVAIAMAIGLFFLVLFTVAALLWVAVSLVGLGDAASDVIGVTSFAVAGLAVIVFLARVGARRAGTTYP